MAIAGGLGFLLPRDDAWLSLVIIALGSGACFITFIFRNGLHKDILAGLLLTLGVMAIGFIPVIGWIVVVCFVLYNIARTLDGLKSLIPDVLVSAVIYGLMYSRLIFNITDPIAIGLLFTVYLLVSARYCRSMAALPSELALFKMSVMWLSIPLVVLTIVSLVSALGNLFRSVSSSVTRTVLSPQVVAGHMRNGIEISSYTRTISSTVTESVTKLAPSAGVIAAGVAGETAQALKKEQRSEKAAGARE